MLRVISMLLLVLGIIIIGVGIALSLSDMDMAVIVIILGVVIIICANILDKKYLKEKERRYFQKMVKEIKNLREIGSWSAEKVLKTDSELEFGMLLFSLFFIVMGPILIRNGMASDPVDWKAILVSSCVLAIAVFYLSNIIPYLGKPACELSQGGFFTPQYGFIPWHQVFGIYLLLQENIFDSRHYTLFFHVKNSESILKKHSWLWRILVYLSLVRTRAKYFNISIALHSKCETPETIEMAAKSLWNKATGRQYDWNPWLSDAYNDAVRRVSENSVNIEDGQENELLPDQAQQLKQHKRDLKIIKNELCRSASQLKWMIKISIFGMLMALLWMFLEQFFL